MIPGEHCTSQVVYSIGCILLLSRRQTEHFFSRALVHYNRLWLPVCIRRCFRSSSQETQNSVRG